jgi:hypothetical protein
VRHVVDPLTLECHILFEYPLLILFEGLAPEREVAGGRQPRTRRQLSQREDPRHQVKFYHDNKTYFIVLDIY